MDNYSLYELNNKLRYLLVPLDIHNSCSVHIYVKIGSVYENMLYNGISHFIEHMVFKGTKKRKNSKILLNEMDKIGAEYNAYTDNYLTVYHFKVNYKYLDVALDIFSDMLFNSVFNKKEIDLERKVIFEEMLKGKDDTDIYLDDLIPEYLFKNHELSKSVIGNRKTLMNCNKKILTEFYKKYYIPSNMCISICGKYNKNKIHSMIKKYFSQSSNLIIDKKIIKKYNYDIKYKLIDKYKDIEQSVIGMVFPTFDLYDNRKYTLDLLETILAGNMSSILYFKIREKEGLVYSISCDSELYNSGGYLIIKFASNYRNIKTAIEHIIKELNILKKKGITLEKLNDSKEYLNSSIYMINENNSNIAEYYGRSLALNEKIESISKYINKINNITLNDIKLLCNNIFDYSKMLIFNIGKKKLLNPLFSI